MTAEDMWRNYLKSIGESTGTFKKTYEAWYFCDNETDASNLADLTIRGIKRATASLKKSYEIENEPLPKEEELNIITDFYGDAVCIIKVRKVDIIPFNEITEEHAKIEGEGDCSLAYWREEHLKVFEKEAKALNAEFNENDMVVFMTFQVIHQ